MGHLIDEASGVPRAISSPIPDPLARLRRIPWQVLDGHAGAVTSAIGETLAGAAAQDVIDRTLRAHRALTSAERTAWVEAIFGVALWRRRLAFHAGVGEVSGAAPGLLLFALLRDLAGVPEVDALRWSGLEAPGAPGRREAPDGLADRYSLPDWIVRRAEAAYGADAEAFAAAICRPGPITLRANRLRCEREGLAKRLADEGVRSTPCAYATDGLQVDREERPNLLGLKTHREGWFEVQDEGSQLVGQIVDAQPGETVLDYCAGAGGKTLLLASTMRNRGRLLVHDVDASKLERLWVRAGGAGVSCLDPLDPNASSCADRVLVDAPCSELGALRRGPDARFRLVPESLADFPERQIAILRAASRYVRPRGRLVYATCTFGSAENDAVVEQFLALANNFRLVERAAGTVPEVFLRGDFFECSPHRHGTDGFFACVLART